MRSIPLFAPGRLVLLCVALVSVAAGPIHGTRAAPRRGVTADTPRSPEGALSAAQVVRGASVPTTQQCVDAGLVPCYTPSQIQQAYNVQGLIGSGIDGSGQGIVIVVSFGSPTLLDDVAAFSTAMNLPQAKIQQLYPLGHEFAPTSTGELAAWAHETTIDAEWAHALAPGAAITVLASPVDETEGVQGLPEFRQLEQYALDNHLGNVISQSWSTSEDLLSDAGGQAERAAWDDLYARANAAGVTILSASGDHGPLADRPDEMADTVRSANWPASEPSVTAVGGTVLTLNDDGSYGSETVWQSGGQASGSGVSSFYGEPAYQRAALGNDPRPSGQRAIADVAAPAQGLILYYAEGGESGGPHADLSGGGGTSVATPMWAGIVALADQMAGEGLGNINPALYALGAGGRCFHDVTEGSNAINADPGEPAVHGWDFPTGWGSPDAGCLVPALAASAQAQAGQ
jgi:subtilase family serine protease